MRYYAIGEECIYMVCFLYFFLSSITHLLFICFIYARTQRRTHQREKKKIKEFTSRWSNNKNNKLYCSLNWGKIIRHSVSLFSASIAFIFFASTQNIATIERIRRERKLSGGARHIYFKSIVNYNFM